MPPPLVDTKCRISARPGRRRRPPRLLIFARARSPPPNRVGEGGARALAKILGRSVKVLHHPPYTSYQLALVRSAKTSEKRPEIRDNRPRSETERDHELPARERRIEAQLLQSSRRKTRATRLRLNISHKVENTDCATIESQPVCICFHILYFYHTCLRHVSVLLLSFSRSGVDPELWHSPDALV